MASPAMSADALPASSGKRQLLLSLAVLAAILSVPFMVWRELSESLLKANFIPHLYCYLAKPSLIWTHVTADALIALSYLMISATLAYLVHKGSSDIPFHWVFLSFGLFIVACGATHLIEVVTVWKPVYVLSAVIKVFTATASLMTAVALPFTVPRVLKLIQGAKAAQKANAELEATEAHREILIKELREHKEMFESFFDSAPDAILVTDRRGHITDVNQQSEQMFGFRREELIGRPIEALVPEHLREGHHFHREKYFSAPKVRPMGQGLELFARRQDGSQFPVDITLSPMRSGATTRVLAAVRDMTEQRLAQDRLQASLREKEVLLREIHHRVKNNLAVICSLFYLESTYAKDEHAAQVFRDSENRVHSMALVHESLYGSKDLSRIDFSEYAKVLATNVLSSYGNNQHEASPVQLKDKLDPVIMSIELAVPCGLILNELISNACKHGFSNARGGEINLSLHTDPEGNCLLRVDDNGAGLPDGLDVNTRKSLGLRLVRSLTKQIRGSFELLPNQPGTSARVRFPVEVKA